MNLKPGIKGLGKPIDAKRNVRLMILTTMRNSQRTVCQKIACLVTEKKYFSSWKRNLCKLCYYVQIPWKTFFVSFKFRRAFHCLRKAVVRGLKLNFTLLIECCAKSKPRVCSLHLSISQESHDKRCSI